MTPTPSRARSLADAAPEETVDNPPATSHAPSVLGSDIMKSHFHDGDLCVLLHQETDPNVHETVKKAVRKAIRARVKKLGMKHDNEVSSKRAHLFTSVKLMAWQSIQEYRKLHDHDHSVHRSQEDGDVSLRIFNLCFLYLMVVYYTGTAQMGC